MQLKGMKAPQWGEDTKKKHFFTLDNREEVLVMLCLVLLEEANALLFAHFADEQSILFLHYDVAF